MAKRTASPPLPLHETDETAWLELTARLVAQARFDDIDRQALAEYLTDMARRDRREVANRLPLLIAHLLKWQFQPENRSNSWRGTIVSQHHELQHLLEGPSLRKHAGSILAQAYSEAVARASAETGLAPAAFPPTCPYSVDSLLNTLELE